MFHIVILSFLSTIFFVNGVKIGTLPTLQHGVTGELYILDTKTISVVNFNYDGAGPSAWFYYYEPGVSVTPSGGGVKIPLPEPYGQADGSLKSTTYVNVNITVTLPDGVVACNIGTFTVWCEPFTAIFTKLQIPTTIFETFGNGDDCTIMTDTVVTAPPPEFDNCIVFDDKLQLSWRVNNDQSNVRMRLCGCQTTVSSTNQYMGFGLSGSTTSTQMIGADATIAWIDAVDGPQAVDYYISAYTQCNSNGIGACPDVMDSSSTCTNDVYNIEGSVNNGIQCVSFTRNLSTSDTSCDTTIDPTNDNQYIVWAIGGLGETAFKHFLRAESSADPIHLGRTPLDQCINVDLVCDTCDPFVNNNITVTDNATFSITIGPSGNERGYMGITGRAGWGIAFYVNGTLIPELLVERGSTYTFMIYGGTDSTSLSNYHPLYITDSISGAKLQNTNNGEIVYAGFNSNGNVTAIGDLCQLTESTSSQTTRESCSSTLEAYIDTLITPDSCSTGQPGILIWSPDHNTPDLVYYQCATHLNLGWKIHVLNDTALPTVAPSNSTTTDAPITNNTTTDDPVINNTTTDAPVINNTTTDATVTNNTTTDATVTNGTTDTPFTNGTTDPVNNTPGSASGILFSSIGIIITLITAVVITSILM